ncbi:MAG TPA: hypothetical protein VFX16_09980 [Pseudonocardiaceae bacterium]|nr:hypothetical protein [Pseudonocardiaceae bacterium]
MDLPLAHADLGRVLLDAVAEHYERQWPSCSLVQFEQSNATYLFDLASAVGAAQEDRTVAAWAVTSSVIGRRDVSYQRGFPMPPDPDGTPVDRGHLIPHLSGGEFGPNIFRQHRALNRGWSEEGQRFRALEREAAVTPGVFYCAHLLYEDDTAYPTMIESGLHRRAELRVESFRIGFRLSYQSQPPPICSIPENPARRHPAAMPRSVV